MYSKGVNQQNSLNENINESQDWATKAMDLILQFCIITPSHSFYQGYEVSCYPNYD